jgi:hypothetical protein
MMAVDGVPRAVRGTVNRVPIQRRRAQALRLIVIVASAIVVVAGTVVIVAIAIVQTGLAQHPLNLLTQRLGNVRSVALAARDAAYVGRVDVQLQRDAFEDASKIRQRFKRVRGNITLVTVHDFLFEPNEGGPIRYQP